MQFASRCGEALTLRKRGNRVALAMDKTYATSMGNNSIGWLVYSGSSREEPPSKQQGSGESFPSIRDLRSLYACETATGIIHLDQYTLICLLNDL
jgi:hypothetical protein